MGYSNKQCMWQGPIGQSPLCSTVSQKKTNDKRGPFDLASLLFIEFNHPIIQSMCHTYMLLLLKKSENLLWSIYSFTFFLFPMGPGPFTWVQKKKGQKKRTSLNHECVGLGLFNLYLIIAKRVFSPLSVGPFYPSYNGACHFIVRFAISFFVPW